MFAGHDFTFKKIFSFLSIIGCVGIYSLATVCAKFAAAHDFFSVQFILIYILEIICLGIYALLWQQLLKKYKLSTLYSYRATALMWVLIWSVVIFGESITMQKAIAVMFVLIGMIVVSRNE